MEETESKTISWRTVKHEKEVHFVMGTAWEDQAVKNCHALYKVMGINVDRVWRSLHRQTSRWVCFSRSSKRETTPSQRGASSSKATVRPRLRSEAFPFRQDVPHERCRHNKPPCNKEATGHGGKPSPPRIPSSGYCLTSSRSDRRCIPAAPECWTC